MFVYVVCVLLFFVEEGWHVDIVGVVGKLWGSLLFERGRVVVVVELCISGFWSKRSCLVTLDKVFYA